jgi:ketosteroid isomerase-like protein
VSGGADVGVEELAARVRELEDERAISDVLMRLSDAFVQIELESWLDCFTEDAVFTMRRTAGGPLANDMKGHAELVPWFVEHGERVPLGVSNQLLGQLRVSVDGNTAEATSLAAIYHRLDDVPTLFSTVRFADTLVRCADGKWRVQAHHGVTQMRLAHR